MAFESNWGELGGDCSTAAYQSSEGLCTASRGNWGCCRPQSFATAVNRVTLEGEGV